ncbi:MAG: MBL fold metallo-hydrolase [Clostridia bacterium]|nr:MBL fold metallo-hydrolase [Clostridia bacterium]
MLKVYKILPVGFAANTYLVTADGKNAVAVDPAQAGIVKKAEALGLTVRHVLLTHGHYDHVGGCFELAKAGADIYCGEAEKELVSGEDSLYLKHGLPMPDFPVKATLTDGQKITLCGMEFTVIATPGHTVGSVVYQVENHLFTGDTLFCQSVGRTDLPTGDGDKLFESIQKLYALDGDFTVHTGHDEDTTLSFERKHNFFIRAE